MTLAVVDENLLIVANDLTRRSRGVAVCCPEANDECRLNAVNELTRLVRMGGVILDIDDIFFTKYRSCSSMAGQPGVGDAFLKVVFERGYDPNWATRVLIVEGELYRLPEIILSSGFDRDDLCWLSAAYNSPQPSEVLNAVDSDYREWAEVISDAGISVREIC